MKCETKIAFPIRANALVDGKSLRSGKSRTFHASALISSRFSSFRSTSTLRGSARIVTRERRERVTLSRSGNGSLRGDRGSLSRGRVVLPLWPGKKKNRKRSRPTSDARSFVIFNYGRVRGVDCVATLDRVEIPFIARFLPSTTRFRYVFFFTLCHLDRYK